MERGGHGLRRSKRAPAFEGLPQVPKLRIGSRFSSHPLSYINENIRNEMSVEIGKSSFGRATDRPVASFRAKRIYKESEPRIIHKETEPKRRSLSGIARLLRREGLPSLWHSYKQKKRFLDSYRQNNTSIDLEPNRQLYDDQSNRRSQKKHQEFKDVCEDLETSSYASRRHSSRWSASSMLTKSDMAVMRKNLQSKRLTHDETASEKLQESDGLYDTSDSIDSRDISPQSHRKQDPLLPNIVQDLRGTSSNSLGCPTTLLNPPNSAKYSNVKSKISDTDLPRKHKTTYHQNSDDGHRTPATKLKERNKKNVLPTPIVLLRPNQEDVQNGNDSSPYYSQSYSPNSRRVNRHHTAGCSKELSWRKTKSYYDAEFFMPDCEEARKLANKITRHLRHACDENEDKIYTVYRRYLVVGDLYNAEKGDLNSELEMLKWSSRSSFSDDNKRSSHPSCGSVNKEAKKRLPERWKITNRFQDLELVGKASTLGEMFTTPDGEKRSRRTSHGRIDRSSTQLDTDNGSSTWHGFGGTINKVDLKNKTKRTSISRLVPPIGGITHGRGTCHDILVNKKHLLHSEPISHGTSKVSKQHPSHKDHFSSQGSRFRDKKPLLCPPIYIEEVNSSLEARFEIQMEANVKDLPHRKHSFQMGEKDDCIWSDVSETVAVEALLSESSLLHPNNSANESSSSPHDQKDFYLQERQQGASEEGAPSLRYLGDELVSLESSSVDYASPVSVLEIPSVEDASFGSEFFERVGAELNDLQIQLQLLKMEVSAYDDKSTVSLVKRGSTLTAEGWEASYIVDVLICAGLDEFGFDLRRHSPDCPLDPILFDILEEKYCNEMGGMRPERLLLFDRINSALSEIFQKHVDLLPWPMPKLAGSINLTWQKRRARDTVEKLILQESANTLHYAKRMLDRDMQWSDFKDEIALTANEIEKLLLDELLNELLF